MRGEELQMLERFEERNFFELLAEDAKFGIESRASLVAARCVEKQIAATSETKKSLPVLKKLC